ncbi:KPN_02809 family neutral zinc metallopeptidase [Aeromicrobium sp. Sec7.5]|uniref:KPN_02809 family neutral zinc metallopeptidase n=1 Tax=Aeromicrobium sp. Sec7.5 TaxID=3121276 RepID=UPI002FE4E8E6
MSFNDKARLDTSQVIGGKGGAIAGGGVGGIILLLVFVFLGGGSGSGSLPFDPSQVLQGGSGSSVDVSECQTGADANRSDVCRIVGTVNSAQDYWSEALPADTGVEYREAPTVIFSGSTQSACGTATAAVGPFYCPTDEQVYIDATFFDELSGRFGADGGNLAQMYVVAHEYGHHVEQLLGDLEAGQQDRSTGPLSAGVRIELRADCLAGVWAHHAATTEDADGITLLEPLTRDDIASALSAAAAVGDDHIQEELGGGTVNPDSWTHGSSEQRQRWFLAGYESGTIDSCDTFGTDDL